LGAEALSKGRQELGEMLRNAMILKPSHNIWCSEGAHRAAVLIDAASYYGALRESLIKAQSSIFVVGWDLDRRTRLVGESGKAADGYPGFPIICR
jgi:phospholipase D1/2